MALVLGLISIVGFGQINISSSKQSTRINSNQILYHGIYGEIKNIDSVYYICVNDLKSDEVLYVKIGIKKEDVINSLIALDTEFSKLKNKEYIAFNDGIQNIIMYKWGGVPYFSNGTGEYVHQYLKRSTLAGLFGGRGSIGRESDKMIGCLDVSSCFRRAIDNLNVQ